MSETLDFFKKREKPEAVPKEDDERWRLSEMYGPGADRAPLKKGEAAGKKKARDVEIRGHLEQLRKKLGIHRPGDQEKFSFEERK